MTRALILIAAAQKTALIVVDLQKGIVAYPTAHPIDEVVSRARSLADAFRARGLPVALVNVSGSAPGRTEVPRNSQPFAAGWTDFDLLGYRVVQKKSPATRRHVGNLFIPKGKLQLLRDKIRAKVRKTPTGRTLADLIDKLNPIIVGWRNYYRYASRAWKEFSKLDWWLDQRIALWLRRKHDKTPWADLFRHYAQSRCGKRKRWRQEKREIALFAEAHQQRYPDRGIRIPNGWNAVQDERFRKGADKHWEAFNTLAFL